jgi:hypothetical protein
MTPGDWQAGFAKSLGVFLNGAALPDLDPRGHPISDDSFLLLFNGHSDDVVFVLPGRPWGQRWLTELDTAGVPAAPEVQSAGAKVIVAARSVQILRRVEYVSGPVLPLVWASAYPHAKALTRRRSDGSDRLADQACGRASISVAMTNPPPPDTRLADHECGSVAEEEGDETSWLLAAALVETRRQADPAPRDAIMGLLADMTLERGAGTVTLAALGLVDVAAVLLDFCADSLKESPPTVLGDVLDYLRDESRGGG